MRQEGTKLYLPEGGAMWHLLWVRGLVLNTTTAPLATCPGEPLAGEGEMEGHVVTASPPPDFCPLVRASERDPHSPC